MSEERTPNCARCGKTLQRSYQFCPECGLPASGGSVLSSQIGLLRQEIEATPRSERRPWRRLLVPTASAVMVALVLGVGLLLFNRPLIEMFFPPAEEARAAPLEIAPRWEPQWVTLPKGSFHSGPPFEVSDADLNLWPTVEENIEHHTITNGEWLRFLTAEEKKLRELGIWEAAIPRLSAGWERDPSGRPVVLRDPDTGEPDLEALVADVEMEEIRLYRRWVVGSAGYRISSRGITNGRWEEFLRAEESALRAEGTWASVIPGPASGWIARETGLPSLPPGPVVDIRARPLDTVAAIAFDALARFASMADAGSGAIDDLRRGFVLRCAGAAAGARVLAVARVDEIEDRGSLVQDVSIDAVRRFHEWAARVEVPRDFQMSRFEVRNVLWRQFLEEEEGRLRARGLWAEAVPGREGGWVLDEEGRYTPPASDLDMPVRYVSARAVRAFGDYLTRRLGEPDVEIRMPTPLEWEYAARGSTWNVYSWGNEFPGTPAQHTGVGKTRRGIDENFPLPVDYVDEDTSPLGVVGLGLNVAEWVEAFDVKDRDADGRIEREERRYVSTEIRGASFALGANEARYRARVWDRSIVDPRNAYAYTGVRLVKVRQGD